MDLFSSTIAAVSTPRGKGGIAVIRISGSDALTVAGKMFLPRSQKVLAEYPARAAVFGTILDSEGEQCDEGVATVYRAPASFTGEDTVEIACHGGLAVTEAVLLSALANGARMAERGEFTRRSFVNGKLSLTEAEAVGRLIDADTRERMKLSAGGLRGNVSREIQAIADGLLSTMTALYAAIDYPEEDVGDEGEREIGNTLKTARARVEKLLHTYKVGRAVADGVRCVICGRPNVGKSSLFNAMTGDESAIVTAVAGTTRDILRETVSFGGVTLRLSDTAGLHDSGDTVEKIGIDRAQAEIDTAELVVAVFDGASPFTDEDKALVKRLAEVGAPVIGVLNKADVGEGVSAEDTASLEAVAAAVVRTSAKDDGGVAALATAIAELYGSGELDLAADAVIWDVRQREQLEHCRAALSSAVDGLERGDGIDAVCTLAEEALAALDETDGRGVDERIVTEIFKRFCVGK